MLNQAEKEVSNPIIDLAQQGAVYAAKGTDFLGNCISGKVLPEAGLQRSGIRIRFIGKDDIQAYPLAPVRIGFSPAGDIQDYATLPAGRLHLFGDNFLAAGNDDPVSPSKDAKVSGCVEVTHI